LPQAAGNETGIFKLLSQDAFVYRENQEGVQAGRFRQQLKKIKGLRKNRDRRSL
jgi:hypothetical protein